jgi:DNA-binding CsgD family transcriptional regulator
LGISERTIKAHRGRVMEKLGVQSSSQLLAMVLRVVLTKE